MFLGLRAYFAQKIVTFAHYEPLCPKKPLKISFFPDWNPQDTPIGIEALFELIFIKK